VDAVGPKLSLDRDARDQVVHAVEAAEKRALAAARRSDEGSDRVAVDLEVDVLDRAGPPVRDGQLVDVEDDLAPGQLVGRALALGWPDARDLEWLHRHRLGVSCVPG